VAKDSKLGKDLDHNNVTLSHDDINTNGKFDRTELRVSVKEGDTSQTIKSDDLLQKDPALAIRLAENYGVIIERTETPKSDSTEKPSAPPLIITT
jgi:hypothetical protein